MTMMTKLTGKIVTRGQECCALESPLSDGRGFFWLFLVYELFESLNGFVVRLRLQEPEIGGTGGYFNLTGIRVEHKLGEDHRKILTLFLGETAEFYLVVHQNDVLAPVSQPLVLATKHVG